MTQITKTAQTYDQSEIHHEGLNVRPNISDPTVCAVGIQVSGNYGECSVCLSVILRNSCSSSVPMKKLTLDR